MVDKTTDDLHKLLEEQGKDSAEAQEVLKDGLHEKLDSLEDHGSTNRLLNVAQGLEAIKGFRERGQILKISEKVEEASQAEKRHNQGAKQSRKRIEAELKDIKEMLMSQGMSAPMAEQVAYQQVVGSSVGAQAVSANQLTIPGIPEGPSRTEMLASSISQMAAASPVTFNQQEGQSIAAMKTFADNYSDAGNLGKLADAIEQDKESGEGNLGKRVANLVKALEQGAIGKGDKKQIRNQMSQLTAYADTNKLDIGMGDMMEQFNKDLKNTFKGSVKEFFGIDQTGNNKDFQGLDSGVTDPDAVISNFAFQDRDKLALGQGQVQNATRSFEKGLDEMLSDKGFKAPSGPQRIRDPQGEQMSQAEILVAGRTGIDNESWGEKQTEKLEEIRQLSEDILGVLLTLNTGGGMGMPFGGGGRRGRGGGRRGGPRTGMSRAGNVLRGPGNARVGFNNPGNLKNPVQAQSGRFFEASSPQGQAILKNSGPRNASTMGRITDAVRNPTQVAGQGMNAISEGGRGLKVASGVAKIAGPAFAVADIGMTGYEVYQNQQAVGEEIDERTGEIYTQKSATADNTEAIASTATGLGTAAVGAGYGAAIGTAILPGVGTLVGGAIGGAVGYVAGSKVGQAIGDLFTESEMEKNLKSAEEKGIYQWNWMQDKVVGPLDKATDAELQSMISQDDVSDSDMRKLQDEFYKRNPVGGDAIEQATGAGVASLETAGASPTGAAIDNMTNLFDDSQAMADQASQQVLISNVSNVSGGGEQSPIAVAISKPGPRELNTSSISRLQDSRFT